MGDDRTGEPFRFEYDPATIRYGTGATADIGEELMAEGIDNALVVCGTTVGATPAVIDPVTEGLGDRLAGVFAATTPDKRIGTAHEAARELDRTGADAVVALGGGSSLDVARVASVLAAGDRDRAAVAEELAETGTVTVPDGDLPPVVAVPTTLAGAELSTVAGITAGPESGLDRTVAGGVGDRRLMPRAVVYDPALFATTPEDVLAASAMNGFDKGIETLYAANATPITDATAVRGLDLLADGLRELGREGFGGDGPDAETLAPVVEGIALVQYGVSRPDGSTLSIVHAFGHGLTDGYDVQQGAAHAVVAPAVLEYLLSEVDGRRDLLVEALGVAGADDPAAAVVDAVAGVRDALGLPARLRDVDGPDPDAFRAVAETILADSFLANAPPDLDPTVEEIAGVLREAY